MSVVGGGRDLRIAWGGPIWDDGTLYKDEVHSQGCGSASPLRWHPVNPFLPYQIISLKDFSISRLTTVGLKYSSVPNATSVKTHAKKRAYRK